MHANVLFSNNTILHVVPAAVGNSLSFNMVQGTCHAMPLTNTRRYSSRFWLESFSGPGYRAAVNQEKAVCPVGL